MILINKLLSKSVFMFMPHFFKIYPNLQPNHNIMGEGFLKKEGRRTEVEGKEGGGGGRGREDMKAEAGRS